MDLMKVLFWLSALSVFYTYAGYPLLIALLARLRPCPVRRAPFFPYLSVVIGAYNEEKTIVRRIEDLLAQDYPRELRQIIVVTDGCSDRTNSLVAPFAEEGVLLIPLQERVGKAVALNHGVARAEGEVIVFADARQKFAPDALRLLAANFADASVGCVSGELVLVQDHADPSPVEMGAYWHYEKAVRFLESASGSMVGATGAIYAIRKELYSPLPQGTILDDVLTPMNVARRGYRVIFDSAPKAYDALSREMEQEWTRKVRTLAGNLQLVALDPSLLAPWGSPLWWRFLSHKIFRLLVPFGFLGLLGASGCCDGLVYALTLWLQLFFCAAALAGHLVPALRRVRLVNLALFFVVMNLAVMAGIWVWLSGRCAQSWRPGYTE